MPKVNLKKFVQQYSSKKVFYDRSFQRRSVWNNKDWNSFANSLVRGWATNPIIVLNVENCREHCHKIGDVSSEEYYNDVLSNGYKYISLDGQNRSINIEKFIQNNITITGKLKNEDDEIVNVSNVFFKDCPQRLKDKFLTGTQIQVVEFSEVTKSDAGKIFKAINDGKPLNAQEKRNSYPSPISDFVRKCSNEFRPLTSKILKKEKIDRMLDDEIIAKTLMLLIREYNDPDINKFQNPKNLGLASADVDSFYNLGNDYYTMLDPSCPYIQEELVRAKGIIKYVSHILLQQEEFANQVPLRDYWGVVLLAEHLYDEGYEVHKPVDFMKSFIELERELTVDSESAYSAARQEKMENNEDPNSVSKEIYYFRLATLPHQSFARNTRKEMLLKAFKQFSKKSFGIRKKLFQQDLVFNQAA